MMIPTTPRKVTSRQSVEFWLRLEGLALFVLSLVLYTRSGASWWLFGVLWLAPDLSMLGYLAGPRIGALVYNAIHIVAGPVALALAGVLIPLPALLSFALIWLNHIGLDRVLGYGLKLPEGFRSTHLASSEDNE